MRILGFERDVDGLPLIAVQQHLKLPARSGRGWTGGSNDSSRHNRTYTPEDPGTPPSRPEAITESLSAEPTMSIAILLRRTPHVSAHCKCRPRSAALQMFASRRLRGPSALLREFQQTPCIVAQYQAFRVIGKICRDDLADLRAGVH